METPRENQKPRNILTDVLIVAAAPIIGYLVVFVYEAGFVGEFDIPYDFIKPDITTVFVVVSALFGVVLYASIYANLAVMWWPKKSTPILRSMVRLSPVIAMGTFALLLFGDNKYSAIAIILFFGGFIFFELIFPLITQRGRGTYSEKLAAQEVVESAVNSIPDILFSKWGTRIGGTVVGVLIVIWVSHYLGIYHAKTKENYLIVSEDPELVVLRIYGDRMVTAAFDRKSKVVENKFVIRDISDGLTLKMGQIGPLRIRKIDCKESTPCNSGE